MEDSVLITTKKILGIEADYTAFDLDIIVHINSAFTTLNDLGVGPFDGFAIEDDQAKWADLGLSKVATNQVKSYIYLKTRMAFDPPATSFHIEAMNKQITEHEWRLSARREGELHPFEEEAPEEEMA